MQSADTRTRRRHLRALAAGRVAPGGTRFELDADGRAFQITYPNKTTVALNHDERGRLASFADRLGAVTQYTYHGETNWLKQVVNARGVAEQTMECHPNGWIKKLSSARELQAGLGINVEHATLEDGAPRTTMTSPPSAFAPDTPTVMIDTYDTSIRLVRREWRLAPDEEPLIEEYGYDQRLKRVASPVFGGRTDPSDPTAQCVMDAKLPGLPGLLRVGIDIRRLPALRPKPVTMPLDRQAADEWNLYDEQYDQAGRLAAFVLEHADGEWSEHWKLAFDAGDHVVSLVVTPDDDRPEQTTGYRYDAVGNLIEMTGLNGEVTRYEYDADDALTVERAASGETTRYAYDGQGRLARMTKTGPDGADAEVVEYAHDGAGRLRWVAYHQ